MATTLTPPPVVEDSTTLIPKRLVRARPLLDPEILRRALRRGLYLETNYERPLAPKPEQANFPNACWAAENVVLLPLYRRLSLEAAESIARRVVRISEEARDVGT